MYKIVSENEYFLYNLKYFQICFFFKNKQVDSVISELGLSHVADSKVGGAENRGVSGGERRRVSIGVQLLLDPSKLLLLILYTFIKQQCK